MNQAICDTLTEKLQDDGDTVTLIDLYADGFDPVMSEQDLKAYSQGETLDPMIVRYNEILDQTEKIVFAFPI